MRKKYVFVDLDGTLIDHSTRQVPDSTKEAIKLAQENGHEVILNTGRPPCLFYGIEKELGLESYIGANGRYAVHKGIVLLDKTINRDIIHQIVEYAEKNRIDIAFEGINGFKRQTSFSDLYIKFSENFHLEIPEEDPEFYLNNDIYQITLYYDRDDYKKFEKMFPELQFEISCKYGLDVNTKGGFKELGIKAFMDAYDIDIDDVIAIGDGFNDISVFQYVTHSVAMGNSHEDVKVHASYVTDHISNNGLYNAFKELKLI